MIDLKSEVLQTLSTPRVRLELGRDWHGKPYVQLHQMGRTKGGAEKWIKTGPLLFGDENDPTHVSILRHLAGLIEQAPR